MATDATFPVDPVLTGVAMAYRNRRLIADQVLPRVAPIGKAEFAWYEWATEEHFTIPDTKVGRRSAPNEIEFHGERHTGECLDYGLDDVVPVSDQANAAGTGLNPERKAAEGLTDLIDLSREKRVADLVFNPATYSQKTQLSGTDQWSDFANSDPIEDIMAGLDSLLIRPNVAVIGRPAFSVLARHPKINKALNVSGADAGIATRQAIADLFDLEEVLVGEAFLNTAKRGQTPSYGRVWGKHMALIHRDPMATNTNGRVTFGFTMQADYGGGMIGTDGDRAIVAGSMPEPKQGLRGSTRVRVGESVSEVISGPLVGYFIQDAVG